ncbi:uncharacterized protein VICG_01086 [Vittaforma corneae ATCC 50505]|uniref:Uncharacterized protein n=1 Tax=Vittaforma corneae (strain ATCC 50505) TaxID=993615 RepID=L2GNK5_VITCO|nr:uncharacterized protein VICG_01086 [Vittaforma corneae ATCC 50505]ELA41902.1 hypothetical protein VICG_01086 [Vittaforma corneae ATCC 50505]
MSLISRLYLINLDKNDNFAKKRREMILRFIASLGKTEVKETAESLQEMDPQTSKEVQVSTKQKDLGNNLVERLKTIEIKEVVNKEQIIEKDGQLRSMLKIVRPVQCREAEEFVESLIDNLEYLHYNLAPLLIILIYKELSPDLLRRFLECLNTKLKENTEYFLGQESIVCIFAILCAVYKYSYFEDHKIQSDKDLYIAVLCINIIDSNQNISKIKTDAFDALMESDESTFKIVKGIFHMSDNENSYVTEFNRILSILNGEDTPSRKLQYRMANQ